MSSRMEMRGTPPGHFLYVRKTKKLQRPILDVREAKDLQTRFSHVRERKEVDERGGRWAEKPQVQTRGEEECLLEGSAADNMRDVTTKENCC